MLWITLAVLALAIFSYPGGLASANGTTSRWPFMFWVGVLIGLIAYQRFG